MGMIYYRGHYRPTCDECHRRISRRRPLAAMLNKHAWKRIARFFEEVLCSRCLALRMGRPVTSFDQRKPWWPYDWMIQDEYQMSRHLALEHTRAHREFYRERARTNFYRRLAVAEQEHYVTPEPLPTAGQDELLKCLIEECAEVIQRVVKMQRFGMSEVEPRQSETNRQRLSEELGQLHCLVAISLVVGFVDIEKFNAGYEEKPRKLLKYLQTEEARDLVREAVKDLAQ